MDEWKRKQLAADRRWIYVDYYSIEMEVFNARKKTTKAKSKPKPNTRAL